MADSRDVSTERPNPYAGTLEDLERSVQVPPEDQVIEQPSTPPPALGSTWDEVQRMLKMAGGV